MNFSIRSFYNIILLFGAFTGCISSNETQPALKVRLSNFPNTINTVTSKSYQATLIQRIVFNGLLTFDVNGRPKPLLAKELPKIVQKDSVFLIKYEIRPEAKWDDGSEITSEDVEFSLKLYKCTFLSNSRMRLYLSGINDLIRKENPREFTLVGTGNSSDLSFVSGDFDILQRKHYDEDNLLDNLTISQLEDSLNTPRYNEDIKQFVDKFTADNFKYNNLYFNGAGAYQIHSISEGKFISLTKKENWWADKLAINEEQFISVPKRIDYINIQENLIAINALENGDIDVISDIPSNEFNNLQNRENSNINCFSPAKHRFVYLAINSRLSKFKTIGFRRAITYLIDVENIINNLEKGYATKTIGPISPTNKYYYNGNVTPRNYDPHRAVQLLENEGFIFRNNQWYKPGISEPLSINVLIRPSFDYSYIAQVLKGEAERIGLNVKIQTQEGRIVSKKARNHDFEITIGGLTGNPFSLNFQELFSMESALLGGMNYSGFGSTKSDSLLSVVRQNSDSLIKRHAILELQQMLHDESTMIFLYFAHNKIAVNKRFKKSSIKISSIKPGYDVTSFQLKKEYQDN